MSMTGSGAAASEAVHAQVAAVVANQPSPSRPGFIRRAGRFCSRVVTKVSPKTYDGSSIAFALIATAMIPLYFWLAEPGHTPTNWWSANLSAELWLIYFCLQMFFLCGSLGRTDKVGMKDTVFSAISFLVATITTVVVVMLWLLVGRDVSLFQWNFLFLALLSTCVELVVTNWMRLIVNRRYFSTASGQQQTVIERHDHSDQA